MFGCRKVLFFVVGLGAASALGAPQRVSVLHDSSPSGEVVASMPEGAEQKPQGSGQTENEDVLRAFNSPGRVDGESAGWFVAVLLYGTVGAVVLAFIIYALLYEPPASSIPYKPTEVRRGEHFTPYRNPHHNEKGDD